MEPSAELLQEISVFVTVTAKAALGCEITTVSDFEHELASVTTTV